MLNILEFPTDLNHDLKLKDGIWQYVIVCDMSTNSIFWNRASFVILSKKYTTEASYALIYLLQKEAKALTLWEAEWGEQSPSIGNFINCITAWGRFTNTAGYDVSIEDFWEIYSATIRGITAEPSFTYNEEGITKPYTQHLVKEDIEQVICFDDAWNEQNFFIETSEKWMLFSWMNMA